MVRQGTKVAEVSAAVHPDSSTRTVGGALYAITMSVMFFLALQVWNLNGKMERNEARSAAQQKTNERIERALDRLNTKFDALSERINNNRNGD